MLDSKHKILSFFSDINHFYNDCMVYDYLKNMLNDVCAEYYKKGYDDCRIDATNDANKEGSYGYISIAELAKLQYANHKESENV